MLENGTAPPSFTIGSYITVTAPENFDTDGDEILDFTALVNVNDDPNNSVNGAQFDNLTTWNLDTSFDLEILSGNFSASFADLLNAGPIGSGPVFEDSFPVASIEPFATLFDDDFAVIGFNTDTGDFEIDASLENQVA